MDASDVLRRLLPCERETPYIFVSYSSLDRERVWEDVLELQRRGYNLWLDEANVDKGKPSWKEDALRAIEDYNCALVLFYVSRHSLVSQPCYDELLCTTDEAARETHMGRLDFVAVDAEVIGHIGEFADALRDEIELRNIPSRKKSDQMRILYHFTEDFLDRRNERVRIHPKDEPGRTGDYYADLERALAGCRRRVHFTPEQAYRRAVDYLCEGAPFLAQPLLEQGVSTYAPAALLLAHLLGQPAGPLPFDGARAAELWELAGWQVPAEDWKARGEAARAGRFYAEALAWFLGSGERFADGESLFRAAQMWASRGCRAQTLAALQRAEALGCQRAAAFVPEVLAHSEEYFRTEAPGDEAPIR